MPIIVRSYRYHEVDSRQTQADYKKGNARTITTKVYTQAPSPIVEQRTAPTVPLKPRKATKVPVSKQRATVAHPRALHERIFARLLESGDLPIDDLVRSVKRLHSAGYNCVVMEQMLRSHARITFDEWRAVVVLSLVPEQAGAFDVLSRLDHAKTGLRWQVLEQVEKATIAERPIVK